MATQTFSFAALHYDLEILEDQTDQLVVIEGVLRLRKLDQDGNWSPVGTYGSGSVQLYSWAPTALRELIGFWAELEEDEDAGDTVRFRFSADDGATVLFWDGAAWRVPVDDSEWNSEDEVDAGISVFPFVCSITPVVKLTSGQGDSSPALRNYNFFWEARYDPTEDILRSIQAKLINEVEVNAEFCAQFETSAQELEILDPLWDIGDPVQVFNRTTDPCLRTDLFSSRAGNLVTLTSPQEGEILALYRGRLGTNHIHVSTDADYQLQELPAVVISNTTQTEVVDFLVPELHEQLRSRAVVRLRTPFSRQTYSFQIRCLAQDALHDKKLADAVRRAFDTKEFIRSLALDENFPTVGLGPVGQSDQVSDQLYARIVSVDVSVKEWLPGYRDVPMALVIGHRTHPQGAQEAGEPE